MIALTYDKVKQAVRDAIPEVATYYPDLLRSTRDPELYNVFAFGLKPVLKTALEADDCKVLERAFALFERMALSPDVQVVNLLHIKIFEKWLVGEPKALATAWKYMGPGTKEVANGAAHTLRCEHNLPGNRKRKR